MALICRLNLNLTRKNGIKFGAKSRAGKNSTLKFTSKDIDAEFSVYNNYYFWRCLNYWCLGF